MSLWQGDAGYDTLDPDCRAPEPAPDARHRLGARTQLTRSGPRPIPPHRALTCSPTPATACARPRAHRTEVPSSPRSAPHRARPRRTAPLAALLRRGDIGLIAVACGGGGSFDAARVGPANPTTTSGGATSSTAAASTTTAGTSKVKTIPGMPPVVNPNNLYSEAGADMLSRRGQGRPRPRLCAEPAVEQRVGDRPLHHEGRRHDPGGRQPAARRALVGPAHAVGHQQRGGRTDGTLTPIDPKTGKPGRRSRSTTRTTCTSSPDGKSRDRGRRGLQAARLPRPAHDGAAGVADVPECNGINHADFSIDGTLRASSAASSRRHSCVKIDLGDQEGRSATSPSRGGRGDAAGRPHLAGRHASSTSPR